MLDETAGPPIIPKNRRSSLIFVGGWIFRYRRGFLGVRPQPLCFEQEPHVRYELATEFALLAINFQARGDEPIQHEFEPLQVLLVGVDHYDDIVQIRKHVALELSK